MQAQSVVVRMDKRFRNVNRGEVCGWPPEVAARLVKAGGCTVLEPDGFDADKALGIASKNPGADEKRRMQIKGIQLVFSAVPRSQREDGGKPQQKAVERLLGHPVEPADFEEAWAQYLGSCYREPEPQPDIRTSTDSSGSQTGSQKASSGRR